MKLTMGQDRIVRCAECNQPMIEVDYFTIMHPDKRPRWWSPRHCTHRHWEGHNPYWADMLGDELHTLMHRKAAR